MNTSTPERIFPIKIEIEGFGIFEIRDNLLHRGQNPRIKTYDKDRFRSVQFNTFKENEDDFQKGYDYHGNEIKIRVIYNNNTIHQALYGQTPAPMNNPKFFLIISLTALLISFLLICWIKHEYPY